jgi:type II secretory pathway predicted ATPase ExeA
MYQQHFGLRRALFDRPIAGDGDVFLGARLRDVVENIEIASTTRDSVLLLYGAAGLGKTTIAAHAIRAATTRLAIGWLASAPQTGRDLLELLLDEFGFDAHGLSPAERLHAWREYLRELGATDTRAFIGVENAHDLPAGVLQALESLTRADPNGGPGANVVLMGTPELCGRLDEPALLHLGQRIRLRQRFVPFDSAETEAYLVHEVMVAGGDYDKVFAPRAAEAVHTYSCGVPRLVNNICETALQVAARRHARVTAELVAATAVDLCGLAAAADPYGDAAPADPNGNALEADPLEGEPPVDLNLYRTAPPVDLYALAPSSIVDVYEHAPPAELHGNAFMGDPHPGEDIPTLTESVEIDFESGAYRLVANGIGPG